MAKEKCDCGGMAVWLYMPSTQRKFNPFYCDACISSPDDFGCSCNWYNSKRIIDEDFPEDIEGEIPEGIEGKDWRWIVHEGNHYYPKMTKEDGIWQKLDKLGRPYPCAEYDYSEDGFDKTTWWEEFVFYAWIKKEDFKRAFNRWWKRHICIEVPDDKNI